MDVSWAIGCISRQFAAKAVGERYEFFAITVGKRIERNFFSLVSLEMPSRKDDTFNAKIISTKISDKSVFYRSGLWNWENRATEIFAISDSIVFPLFFQYI